MGEAFASSGTPQAGGVVTDGKAQEAADRPAAERSYHPHRNDLHRGAAVQAADDVRLRVRADIAWQRSDQRMDDAAGGRRELWAGVRAGGQALSIIAFPSHRVVRRVAQQGQPVSPMALLLMPARMWVASVSWWLDVLSADDREVTIHIGRANED